MDIKKAKEKFLETKTKYKFDTILSIAELYPLHEVISDDDIITKKTVKNFITEYFNRNIDDVYDGSMFLNQLLLSGIRIDKDETYYREKYYQLNGHMDKVGLLLLFDISRPDFLDRVDDKFIDGNKLNNLTLNEVLTLAELYSYPNSKILDNPKYPFHLPHVYLLNEESVYNGMVKYQQYMDEKYDLRNHLKDIFVEAIDKRINHSDINSLIDTIYAVDVLTDYVYDIRNEISLRHPELKDQIDGKY